MPVALLIEIINALLALAPQIPSVLALGESAIKILTSGSVTPEEEAAIRLQLDQTKLQIDAGWSSS